jgi:aspartyl-tRNA(Asn)/glutamyl-tRNA(Gln) amidotransferase subunit A
MAFASSLDQIGPLARSAEDCALIMSVIAGYDPKDSTSANQSVPDFCPTQSLIQPLAGLKIGWCAEHFDEGLDSNVERAVRESVAVLRNLGANTFEVHLPHSKFAVAAYYVIAPCEASSNLARYDGVRYTRRAGQQDLESMYGQSRARFFGDEVRRRILLGTFALSSGYYEDYYVKASQVRRLIRNDYEQTFRHVDLIVGPTTPTPPFLAGRNTDPISMYLADVYTVSANLAGIPAISVPCGFSDDELPIGIQLQAPAFREDMLLRVAHWFQQHTDWHQRRPPQ